MSFKEELLQILDEGGELTWLMITRRLSLRHLYYPRVTFYKTVDRLERKGLVKKILRGRTFSVGLTLKGKALLNKPVSKTNRKDGLSTVIIFDIPEKQRKARQALRRYLMRSGYINLQESVMISPFVAGAELKDLLKELRLETFVTVISGRIEHHFQK